MIATAPDMLVSEPPLATFAREGHISSLGDVQRLIRAFATRCRAAVQGRDEVALAGK